MIEKDKLLKELRFCKTLMDRLVNYAEENFNDKACYCNNTVVQNDIIRLRRELNEIRKRLAWDYEWRAKK